MGNKQSCCVYPNHSNQRKQTEDKYQYDYTPTPGVEEPRPIKIKDASTSNLQHISEREPEECDGDPSIHPTTSTIFLERSKSEVHRNNRMRRRSHYDNHYNHYNAFGRLTKKYSSCSTIFIDDSTVSQPNLRNTIKAVALAIYFHIKNHQKPPNGEMSLLEIFDEKFHPLSKDPVPDDYAHRHPEHKSIYRFIRTLFNAAQLTAECAIVTLVYLERLLTYTEIEIIPANWKRILLGAILLASKVWDDQAVWNVDYCQILKDIPVEEMNELERQFLEMLQFNINVPSSVYAKYYFDLRSMADAHDLSFPLEPLSKERAAKLEAMSLGDDRIQPTQLLRRAQSLETLTSLSRHSKAILS